MDGPGLEPDRPTPGPQPAADDGFWDGEAASRDSEVWRYARRLAAAAAQEHDQAARGARFEPAQAVESARPQPRSQAAVTSTGLREVARGVGRALLLVAAALAGVAGGMAAGGSGALQLDPRSWHPLVAQASPTVPALAAGATLVAAARAGAVALQPRARIASTRDGERSAGRVEGLVLAATRGEVPVGVIVRRAPPPEPVVVEPPAAPWRVQLALLRNPRHVGPVWRSFVTRLGSLTRGLERHVVPTRTARGRRHLVQAGPFPDAAAAEALCQRLLAAGGDCLVVPPPS